MSIESKLIKTTCPLCLYGCELPITTSNQGDFLLRKNEYNPDSPINQGRLCARGNAATIILDHKKRLTSPLFNNKNIDWVIALSQIKRHLKGFLPGEIAITYDINNTLEEITSIFNFAQEFKVDLVARSYLEPEAFFSYTPGEVKYAELKDIEQSKVFLVIGDIFNKTPLISKPILDAKYADRNNRLYYIDSVKTRLAGFANKFLWTKPGTEPLLILGLIAAMGKSAREVLGDKNFASIRKLMPKITEICSIVEQDIEEIAQSLSIIPKGVILASMDFGKTDNPLLFSLLAQLLSMVIPGDKKFISPALGSVPIGKNGFGEVIEQINQNKVKSLINFGNNFPCDYPKITPHLKNLSLFVTTSIFSQSLPITGWTLPVPSLLEKTGTINTLWGKDTLQPLAEPVNGSKHIFDIIENISSGNESKSKPRITNKSNININDIIGNAIEYIEKRTASDELKSTDETLIVLGEESAFGYRGIFENNANQLKINPITAQKQDIKSGDSVKLKINDKEKEFIVNITPTVPIDAVSISIDTSDNRILFPFQIDSITKEVIIPPTKARLSKVN